MPEVQGINDGTTTVKEKDAAGVEINIIQRTGDPLMVNSLVELNKKKGELASFGFSIREMSKEDFKDGVGFVADKKIQSDTVKRLAFAFKPKKA